MSDDPLGPPDDLNDNEQNALSDTHPATDTNIDSTEAYDEGVSGAAEAAEPNRSDAVVGYDPTKDHRLQHPL